MKFTSLSLYVILLFLCVLFVLQGRDATNGVEHSVLNSQTVGGIEKKNQGGKYKEEGNEKLYEHEDYIYTNSIP
ncbi:hypothetical protein ACHQM5_022341 [Ranunculus cassubicifolius]